MNLKFTKYGKRCGKGKSQKNKNDLWFFENKKNYSLTFALMIT